MFSLNFSNAYGNGSFYPDAGFKFTDRLNLVNEANFVFSSSSSFRRSQLDIGTVVSIVETDTYGTTSQEFYGFIDDIQTVEGGGMNVHALGQEAWLGKQNGAYSGSPWNNVSAVTIFNAIVGESSKITAASSDSFGNTYLNEGISDSLWNAIMNLSKITGQDIDVEYTGSGATIALKNDRHSGSFVSKDTFNSGKEIEDISVGRSFPMANSITVFGRGEGTTRIKSDVGHGQDAGSQVAYGVIYKPVENYTIASVTAANQLADAEVARYAAIIKTYEFTMKVKRYRTDFIAGDLLTLNSQEQSLTDEVVRITQIEKGMKGGSEYMEITVADQAYSRLTKNVDMVVAQNQKIYQQSSAFDQYQQEYANQNCSTCVGGMSYFNLDGSWSLAGKLYHCLGLNPYTCLCDIFVACYGEQYLHFNPGLTVCMQMLQVGNNAPGYSSLDTLHHTGLNMCGCNIYNANLICATCFCGAGGGGGGCWANDGAGYICPCNSCGISLNASISDSTSNHSLGIAMSPGAFKDVNACCGMFTTCVYAPYVCGSTCLRGGNICATIGCINAATCINSPCYGSITSSGCISGTCVGIGASSTCPLYVSGNSYLSACTCMGICGKSPILCASTCVDSPNINTASTLTLYTGGTSRMTISGSQINTISAKFNGNLCVAGAYCVYNYAGDNCGCVGTLANTHTAHYAYCFCTASTCDKKINFQPVDTSQVLEAYKCLPICSWEFRCRAEVIQAIQQADNAEIAADAPITTQVLLNCGDGKRKIGPIAEDYYKAFKGLVPEPTVDESKGYDLVQKSGLQDAAIKELINCVSCLNEKISCLEVYKAK